MRQSSQNSANPELVYVTCMLQKTMQNRDLALVLFKKLFLELPEQIKQLENTLATQELAQALAIIHKLHGSVGFCGFTELHHLSNNLENSLFANNLPAARYDFEMLKQNISFFQSLQHRILQQLEK